MDFGNGLGTILVSLVSPTIKLAEGHIVTSRYTRNSANMASLRLILWNGNLIMIIVRDLRIKIDSQD